MVAIIVIFNVFLYNLADGQFSLPLVYLSYSMPFLYGFFLIKNKFALSRIDLLFIIQMVLMFSFAFLHTDTFRPSTVFYSCLFIFTFLYYKQIVLQKSLSAKSLMKLLEIIMYAYAIIMFIQQMQVYIFHTAALNAAPFQTSLQYLKNGLKFNSLAIEASNVPLIELLLMNLYLTLDEHLHGQTINIKKSINNNWKLWFCFGYTIISTLSLTSVFIIFIFLIRYIKIKIRSTMIVLFATGLFFIAFKFSFPTITDRFISVINTLFSFNSYTIIDNDASSAARLFPFFEYFKTFSITDINTWIGHGNDTFLRHINIVMFGDPDMKQGLGNICSFLYDYGLIVGMLFFYELKLILQCKVFSYEVFLYIFCFSILDINHFLLWDFIMLMFTSKQYSKFLDAKMIHVKLKKNMKCKNPERSVLQVN